MHLNHHSSEKLALIKIKEKSIEVIDYYKIGYILFGEHPRELISPESGIHFLNDLCFETSDPKNK